ncbi:MAG: hypothetical protein J5654_10105 [Victivallales bacterium]|nr:hypothetical protein [Victivallales bacterium]
MAKLTHWLKMRCRMQCVASGVGLFFIALTGFEFVALMLWGLESITKPVQENISILLIISILFILSIAFVWNLWRLWRSSTVLQKAREYSREHPEEHDALEAIVELEQKSTEGQLRPFEQEFLQDARGPYLENDFHRLRQSKTFRQPQWLRLALAAMAPIFICLVFHPPILIRAWNGLVCRVPGLTIIQMRPEVERHQDMEVVVQVNRYGGTPSLEVWENGVLTATPMQPLDGNRFRIVLYDITEPLVLRARTDFVASDRHRITVYDPPAPMRIAIDTTPPAYTGRVPQHLDDFSDLELINGEALHIECEMPEGQTCQLLESTETIGIPVPCTLHPLSAKEMRLQAEYRDADGHTAKGPAFTVTARPDLVPVIELIEPTADATCKPGETPSILANVIDDFGITAVEAHFYLDKQPEAKQLLWLPETDEVIPRQLDVVSRLTLADQQLAPGQLLTGWLEATDNRAPEVQRARSELFFITIVPDESDFESNMEGMDGEEAHEVNVSDLIVESKRLLRNTFDLSDSALEPLMTERLHIELERDLRALELAVRARSIDLAQQFGLPHLPPEIQQFFNDAAEQLVQAATDVTANALKDSLSPQQTALVTLTRLNNLLLENMMKMRGKGEGESNQQPGQETDEENEEQLSAKSQTAAADRQQEITQLQAAREELRKILQEQRAILDDIRRANRLASSYAEPEHLLAKRTQNVGGKLAGIAEAEAIQTPLRNATTELDNSGQDFKTPGHQGTAVIHARRAEKNLQDSLTLLEQLLRQLTSQQVEKLSEDAKKLANRQSELSQTSQKFSENPPDDATRKSARDAQEKLSQATEELRQRIEQTARAMERESPQAARQLRSAMTTEDAAALQRSQSRARNALNYRRYETAATEQQTASQQLEELSERLADAADQTGLSPEQLQQALEELQRLSDETTAGKSAEELSQLAQEAADLASQTGRRLGNDALQMTGNELREVSESGATPERLQSQMLDHIERMRTELRQELARVMEDATLRPTPPATAPPRQYRQEVEEYFRRLGE